MALLLILPTAIFGLVALLVALIDALIEIAERRRAPVQLPRKIFRPVVIEGGKGTIASPPITPDDGVAEPAPIKLVRSAPP